jgi:transcriptional regulator with XRE-family HTH domain
MDIAIYHNRQMASTPASRIAANLRALRAARSMSTVTLAKLSGVARATLAKIEAGSANPTIDTLYALADTLGVALGDLIGEPPASARVIVIRAGDGTPIPGPVSPILLDRLPTPGLTELYQITFTTRPRTANPHPPGTLESLYLTTGHLRTGPTTNPVDLGPGDYIRFPGDLPHLYQAIDAPAHGILVMSQP